MHSVLRFHSGREGDGSRVESGGVQYCEQLVGVQARPDEDEAEKMEWRRSFTSTRVNPLKKEAVRERIALEWDCTSKGGCAKYVALDDEQVYSLTGHVGEGERREA